MNSNTEDTPRDLHGSAVLRMSQQDFALWGLNEAAYVKTVPVVDDSGEATDQVAYSIHAADGRHLGFAQSRDLAFAAVRREGMEPVSVH